MAEKAFVAVGYVAGCCTTFSGVPQIVRVMKTQSTGDLSYVSLGMTGVGVVLWTAYGAYLKNGPILVFNVMSTVLAAWLIGYKAWNERKRKMVVQKEDETAPMMMMRV